MPGIKDSELLALVALLDDTDEEILRHVTEKLTSLGPGLIPKLEAVWETAKEPVIQERIEDVIGQIHFNDLLQNVTAWLAGGCRDLLEGALLVNKFMFPDQDESRIIAQLERLYNNVWIEYNGHLTPTEEVMVIDHVMYVLHGFSGNSGLSFDPDLGYLGQVLQTKKGNSITLGIIFLIITQKLDMPVYGVNLPYHFVMAYASRHLTEEELENHTAAGEVMFYINPINKGAIFSSKEIDQYLEKSQIKSQEFYYAPCHNRRIIQSLIMNQLACYDHNGDLEKAKQLKILYDLFVEQSAEEEEVD